MQHVLKVQSTAIDWQRRELEVRTKGGEKHVIPLHKTIGVAMIGYPEKEQKTMLASELGPYMSRGYVIEQVTFEDDQKTLIENWIVAARVTEAAKEIIEANGGKVEVLREDRPYLVLITLTNALYHGMHNYDNYFAWTLNRDDKTGICYWGEEPIGLTIYRWTEESPNDPDLIPPDDVTAGSSDDPFDDHPF